MHFNYYNQNKDDNNNNDNNTDDNNIKNNNNDNNNDDKNNNDNSTTKVVVITIIIKSQFQTGDFSAGSTTGNEIIVGTVKRRYSKTLVSSLQGYWLSLLDSHLYILLLLLLRKYFQRK